MVAVFVEKMIAQGFRSVSVIGMGKNTGKTFSFNQLVMDAARLGIKTALTSIGLDGEEQDSLFHHHKPRITICPGQIVANAKSLILESGLDYEILATTGVMTPLGEVVLARARSSGQTILAGPATRFDLVLVKEKLEEFAVDLLLVDGAIDRRSLSVPVATDTTILAVGAEVSWDRALLLEKLCLQVKTLSLPAWNKPSLEPLLRETVMDTNVKVVLLAEDKLQSVISQESFFQAGYNFSEKINSETETVFVRGMLTDAILAKVLESVGEIGSVTILAADPTCVFLSRQSLLRITSRQASLKVLDTIHISAVTVNPFNSSFGQAEPLRLLRDVGQAVDPIPAYDLNLGIRYSPKKGGV